MEKLPLGLFALEAAALQRLLRIAVVVAVVAISLLCVSLRDHYLSVRDTYTREASIRAWMEQVQKHVGTAAAAHAQDTPGDESSMLSIATTTAEHHDITVSLSERNLQLWVDDAPVDATLLWLDELTLRHRLHIDKLMLVRGDAPGVTSIQMELSSP